MPLGMPLSMALCKLSIHATGSVTYPSDEDQSPHQGLHYLVPDSRCGTGRSIAIGGNAQNRLCNPGRSAQCHDLAADAKLGCISAAVFAPAPSQFQVIHVR